jgi:hypothetical protein
MVEPVCLLTSENCKAGQECRLPYALSREPHLTNCSIESVKQGTVKASVREFLLLLSDAKNADLEQINYGFP